MKPRIFLSAVSDEFGTLRARLIPLLTKMGYEPVCIETFPTGDGDLRPYLCKHIDSCTGLIQLVGKGYGREPPTIDPDYGRVSYTQFEYLYAYRCGKKTWIFIAEDSADVHLDKSPDALDLPPAEHADPLAYQTERSTLQRQYLELLKQEGRIRNPFRSLDRLENLVHGIRDELLEIHGQWNSLLGQVERIERTGQQLHGRITAFQRAVNANRADPRFTGISQAERLRAQLIDGLRRRFDELLLTKMSNQLTFEIAPSIRVSRPGEREAETAPVEMDLGGNWPQRFKRDSARCAWVTGEAGSGKSLLLVKIALSYLDMAEETENTPIPVILSAPTYAANEQDFEAWLRQEVAHAMGYCGVSAELAKELIANALLMPLVDSLDELSDDLHRPLLEGICAYSIHCENRRPSSGLKFVVATRPAVETKIMAGIPDCVVYEIGHLDEDRVRSALNELADKNLSARLLTARLDADPPRVAEIRTAFHMHMLLATTASFGNVPSLPQAIERYCLSAAESMRRWPTIKVIKWLTNLSGWMDREQSRYVARSNLPSIIGHGEFEATTLTNALSDMANAFALLFAAPVGAMIALLATLGELQPEVLGFALMVYFFFFSLTWVGLWVRRRFSDVFAYGETQRRIWGLARGNFDWRKMAKTALQTIGIWLSILLVCQAILVVIGNKAEGFSNLVVTFAMATAWLMALFLLFRRLLTAIFSHEAAVLTEQLSSRKSLLVHAVCSALVNIASILASTVVFTAIFAYGGGAPHLFVFAFWIVFAVSAMSLLAFSTPSYLAAINLALARNTVTPFRIEAFLTAATTAGLMQRDGRRFKFRHDLIRQWFTSTETLKHLFLANSYRLSWAKALRLRRYFAALGVARNTSATTDERAHGLRQSILLTLLLFAIWVGLAWLLENVQVPLVFTGFLYLLSATSLLAAGLVRITRRRRGNWLAVLIACTAPAGLSATVIDLNMGFIPYVLGSAILTASLLVYFAHEVWRQLGGLAVAASLFRYLLVVAASFWAAFLFSQSLSKELAIVLGLNYVHAKFALQIGCTFTLLHVIATGVARTFSGRFPSWSDNFLMSLVERQYLRKQYQKATSQFFSAIARKSRAKQEPRFQAPISRA